MSDHDAKGVAEPLALVLSESKRSYTYLAGTHVALVTVALAVAILWRLPVTLLLAAPSIFILLSSMLESDPVPPVATATLDRPRALEGDTVTLSVLVRGLQDVAVVDIEMRPDARLDHSGSLRVVGSLDAGETLQTDFELITNDWGVVQLGTFLVQTRDRFGLISAWTTYRISSTLRVHIHEEPARSLIEPDRFRRLVGSHLSEERSEGCEIADVRPYQPGDRLRSLNWRISARNDEPWVTLRHPDRSTTVVLLLDAYQRLGTHRGDALRRSIRATLGLARLHLAAQDPVGMLVTANGMRWFPPELGPRHLHQLTDALLDLSTSNWASRQVSRNRADKLIPADAIVLAVSSLDDSRFVSVVKSLAARGQSVHVIEPISDWPTLAATVSVAGQPPSRQAWRIYSLQRQVLRSKLARSGVAVIPWDEQQPIESVLLGLRMRQRRSGAEAALR